MAMDGLTRRRAPRTTELIFNRDFGRIFPCLARKVGTISMQALKQNRADMNQAGYRKFSASTSR
jgi:hypothetical protein